MGQATHRKARWRSNNDQNPLKWPRAQGKIKPFGTSLYFQSVLDPWYYLFPTRLPHPLMYYIETGHKAGLSCLFPVSSACSIFVARTLQWTGLRLVPEPTSAI
jgi:hypothetical protein